MQLVLTAYMSARLELGRHLWVHGDHDLFLFSHQRVPLLHLLVDPVLEVLTEHGSTNINDPLLRHLP